MPQRQPVAAIERRERALLQAYANAWARIEKLQAAIANDPAKWRERARLDRARRSIEAELTQLDAQAQEWFSTDFPAIHAMGVNAGAAELGAAPNLVWNTINPDAVAKLAADGFGDLLKATRLTRRTTKALIRSVIGDEVLAKLTTGDTAKAAATRARKLIEQKGIHSVRYKDGSRHGLREYTNMAVRSKTAVAYNLGSVEAQEGQGVRHWEVMDGLGCTWPTGHGPGIQAQGEIVTRDDAIMYPIAHPNCRRAFAGRPDLNPLPEEIVEPQVLIPTAEARERARARTAERVARVARG